MRKIIFILLLLVPVIADGQVITTFAGNGSTSFSGNNVPATAAGIPNPADGVFDKYGNYYFVDLINSFRIRRISTSGIITTVAGNGSSGFNGNGIPATNAKLNTPNAVRLDTVGNLYIADGGNHMIRKVDATTGLISTIVGNGSGTFAGDGLPATAASIYNPHDICFDKLGNLYIADFWNNRIRKVDVSGIITTIAGGGSSGIGENGPATSAQLVSPSCVVVDDSGHVYMGEMSSSALSNRVRKIDAFGIIRTVAGNGSYTHTGVGVPATAASISPIKIAFDTSWQLYIADDVNRRIFRVDNAGIIHLVAGNGGTGFSGDGGPAIAASIHFPAGVSFDPCGNLYIPDVNNRRVRKVTFNPPCNLAVLETNIINNSNNSESLSIYPNPTSSRLHIDNIKPNTTYQLLSIVGVVMQSGDLKEGSNTISIQHLAPGMYLLHLTDEAGERVVRRVVKE